MTHPTLTIADRLREAAVFVDAFRGRVLNVRVDSQHVAVLLRDMADLTELGPVQYGVWKPSPEGGEARMGSVRINREFLVTAWEYRATAPKEAA